MLSDSKKNYTYFFSLTTQVFKKGVIEALAPILSMNCKKRVLHNHADRTSPVPFSRETNYCKCFFLLYESWNPADSCTRWREIHEKKMPEFFPGTICHEIELRRSLALFRSSVTFLVHLWAQDLGSATVCTHLCSIFQTHGAESILRQIEHFAHSFLVTWSVAKRPWHDWKTEKSKQSHETGFCLK